MITQIKAINEMSMMCFGIVNLIAVGIINDFQKEVGNEEAYVLITMSNEAETSSSPAVPTELIIIRSYLSKSNEFFKHIDSRLEYEAADSLATPPVLQPP